MDTSKLENRYVSITLEDEDHVCLDFVESPSPVTQSLDRASWGMVGHFLMDRPIKFDVMRNVLTAVWRPVLGLTVTNIKDNLFRFDLYD